MNKDYEYLCRLQREIPQKVILEDKFKKPIKTVGGIDQAFLHEGKNEKIISAIVICDYKTLEVRKKNHVISDAEFPYVPTFLTFREGPPVVKLFRKLRVKPDILIIDGNGQLHPRKAGIATHIGVILDMPTIGVAKTLLCGKCEQPMKIGEYGEIMYQNEVRGTVLKSKEGCNPIYISVGHRISLMTATKIVKNLLKNHKLPEPLRLAHIYANEIKANSSVDWFS